MFYIYLACLIFGGALLAISLMFGDHGDGHEALDSHGDTDHLLDYSDTDHPVAVHDDIRVHTDNIHNDPSEAAKFFSFRNVIYFAAFFGLTGTVLDMMATAAYLTFFTSLGMGFFSAGIGYYLMKYLKSSETGKALDIFSLKGSKAIVSVPMTKQRKGKIIVKTQVQSHEMLALIAENSPIEEFNKSEEVLIIEIQNNIALVVSADF